MSDGGESNNKGQRLNSQFPTTFDIKDEKLRKYVNGLRVTKRLQDQRITEQDQQITELEAELQNCKRKQAELAKPEKEQQQKLLAEREKQLSEQNLLIAELKEKLAEQEKTIAQHEENKEIYKCQMASIKSFIDENNKKWAQHIAYLEEEQRNFLETIAKLDAELVLKTEVVSNYNGHIKLLEEKIARYENASSQSSPPINARKGKSSSQRSKTPQTRDGFLQSVLPFSKRPQATTTSDSSQSSVSAEFDRSTKRPLEEDMSNMFSYGRRKFSITNDQTRNTNSSQHSLPSSSPKILSSITSSDSPTDMTRIKNIPINSRSQSLPSDSPIRLTATQTHTSQLRMEATMDNGNPITESIIDISESLSQPTPSSLHTQKQQPEADFVDISNTIPSLESTHSDTPIKKQEDDIPSIKTEQEAEQYDLTSLLGPTVHTIPASLPPAPVQQRKPLGNTTNIRRPLGDATNSKTMSKGKSNSTIENSKARHQHGVGQTCMACDKFYDTEPLVDVENNNTILNGRDRIQLHSKHRSRNNNSRATTPPGFWDIDFTLSSQKNKTKK